MSTFVIPMAGDGRRFAEAGYTVPKYALPLGVGTVFDWSVASFAAYFETDDFLFVTRDEVASAFVAERVAALGIASARTVVAGPTRGQADTVARALRGDEHDLYIFNIDTVRPGFTKPDLEGAGGYLETFRGLGTGWSFVEPGEGRRVRRTTEKDRISDRCSTGLYWFDSATAFLELVDRAVADGSGSWQAGELYVAPLYNRLVERGVTVLHDVIGPDEVWFSGVPTEYEDLARTLQGRAPQPSGHLADRT